MSNIFPRIQSALSGEPKAADVAKLISEAEAELTALAGKVETLKATALDPMATEDAVKAARTELTEIDFSRERLTVALDRLRETHSTAQEREREASRADAYNTAKADLERTSAALEARYPQLAREMAEMLIPALDALHAAQKANEKLPAGCSRIEVPAVLSGSVPARKEELVGSEEVKVWAFPSTNAVLTDEQVASIKDGKLNGRPVDKRKFRREVYRPSAPMVHRGALFELLSLPPVQPGERAFWQVNESLHRRPERVAEAARQLLAEHDKPAKTAADKVRFVPLEPAVPEMGYDGPDGGNLRIVA